MLRPGLIAAVALLAVSCGRPGPATNPVAASAAPEDAATSAPATGSDPHSFAQPKQVVVTHVGADWTVDFEQRQLQGSVSLAIDRAPGRTDVAAARVFIAAGGAVFVAPLTLGAIADRTDIRSAFTAVPGLFVLVVVLAGLGHREARAGDR